jgi:hypothetical protein
MSKRHTTPKRKKDTPTTTRRHRYYFSNVVAKKGAKSFVSAEKADAWAKEHDVDTGTMVLHETLAGKFEWRAKQRG